MKMEEESKQRRGGGGVGKHNRNDMESVNKGSSFHTVHPAPAVHNVSSCAVAIRATYAKVVSTSAVLLQNQNESLNQST